MQLNSHDIKIVYSGMENLERMKKLPVRKVFDEEVCCFLHELSSAIRMDKECKDYPDLITFGFFCRKANIERLKNEYAEEYRIGRGFSFHIAPSNVPINFAYTLVAGLLAGNICVVRASTKDFKQTEIICRLIKQIADGQAFSTGKYIAIIQYKHKKEITDFFSALSDIRVIWGGDSTVEEIQKSKIPPRCIEVVFADRYSACVMDAKQILKMKNWKEIAQNFYNDTYLYDQNACSSPHLLYWLGTKGEIEQAKRLFWDAIDEQIKSKYRIEPVIAVDKLTMAYRAAIEKSDVRIQTEYANLIYRIELTELDADSLNFSCPGGSYLEYSSEEISDLKVIATKKFQTLSYLGSNPKDLADWVIEEGILGVDRIVPMGKTADFSLLWDGYDLIKEMSRKIVVQ